MNSQTKQAIETHVSEAFEAVNAEIPEDPTEASVAWIATGMILYEAVRNSYPEAEATDVAGIVAQHVQTAIQLGQLVSKGLAERFTGPKGEIRYRPTAAGRRHAQSILDHDL